MPVYPEPFLANYSPSLITFLVTAIAILVLILVILSIHLFRLRIISNDGTKSRNELEMNVTRMKTEQPYNLPLDSYHCAIGPMDKFVGACSRANEKSASSNSLVNGKQNSKIIGNVYEELAIIRLKESCDQQIEIYNHLQ